MTFDGWWKLFMEKWGKPKEPAQEKLSRTFAKTAWTAGYAEGYDDAVMQAVKAKLFKEVK